MLPTSPGHMATVLVAFAVTEDSPSQISVGKVTSVPPPATELMAPARNAAPNAGAACKKSRVKLLNQFLSPSKYTSDRGAGSPTCQGAVGAELGRSGTCPTAQARSNICADEIGTRFSRRGGMDGTRRRGGEEVSRSMACNCIALTTAFPPGWFAATTKVA